MINITTLYHKNPYRGDHEIYTVSRTFLGLITLYLVCLIYALELRRIFFNSYINFTLFAPFLLGGGNEICNYRC